MEVVYDLDTQARQLADDLGMNMVRARTAGAHPTFVKMVRELIRERIDSSVPRRFLGDTEPLFDCDAEQCCPKGIPVSAPTAG
jgi:ferrochelatase